MAEFRHYTTFEEAMMILRVIVETHHLKLIPDEPRLKEPHLDTFDHWDPAVVDRLARFGMLELEGSFTKHPLAFKQRLSGAAAGSFYLDDTVGPRILWSLPGLSLGAPPTVGPGSIGYNQSYRDPSTGRRIPPSSELTSAFRAIVMTMKKHVINVTIRGHKVWVGRDTHRQIDSGELAIDP